MKSRWIFAPILYLVVFLAISFLIPGYLSHNNNSTHHYVRGKIVKIDIKNVQSDTVKKIYHVQIYENKKKKVVEIEFLEHKNSPSIFKINTKVIVARDSNGINAIQDIDRISYTPFILLLFLVFIVITIGIKGIRAFLGLYVSIAILFFITIPLILRGHDALMICVVSALIISVCSIFITHGLNKVSFISLLCISATLFISGISSYFLTSILHLYGRAQEASFYINFHSSYRIDLRGLLLGGIIIGSLGILDDIIITQITLIKEASKFYKRNSFNNLFHHSLIVGKEHIAALINTLALAYIGPSLPLFVLLATNKSLPLWVILNSEILMEEFVRTFAGSLALVCAVPITSLLGALFYRKKITAN